MTMPPHPGPLPQGERVLSALHIGRYYRRGRRSSAAGGGGGRSQRRSTTVTIVWRPLAPAGLGRTISAVWTSPLASMARTVTW